MLASYEHAHIQPVNRKSADAENTEISNKMSWTLGHGESPSQPNPFRLGGTTPISLSRATIQQYSPPQNDKMSRGYVRYRLSMMRAYREAIARSAYEYNIKEGAFKSRFSSIVDVSTALSPSSNLNFKKAWHSGKTNSSCPLWEIRLGSLDSSP